MQGESMIIYKSARLTTGKSQEWAAEQMQCSVESVKAYESGLRVPPNAVVLAMIQAYGAPWLALIHLSQTSGPLGVLPADMQPQPLPTAAIQLINRVLSFGETHRDRQLMKIAEDGMIDEDERPEFDAIVKDLNGIIAAALQVKFLKEE